MEDKRESMQATIFGASGLVGSELWRALRQDPDWASVDCIGRSRPKGLGKEPTITFVQADLFAPASYSQHLRGEVAFCCLGTTMKKAGSRSAFRRVDHDLPVALARQCAERGYRRFVVISAMGVHEQSMFFYNRVKGEMERSVLASGIPEVVIVRPGLLLGDRGEYRWAEALSANMLTKLDPWLAGSRWHRFRAISARRVAQAMLLLAKAPAPPQIVENQDLLAMTEQVS